MKRFLSLGSQMKTGTWCLVFFLALMACPAALAEEPVYARKGPVRTNFAWLPEIIQHVPLLQHERGQRWPMILWQAGPFEPQPVATYQALLARGLTQHIQLDTNHIPIAQALQAAGSPVIMMQGAGGPWPARLAGDPKEWAHQFVSGYEPATYARPCLAIFKGWTIAADNVRTILQRFKEAGVTVDAVWMDWEGDPMFAEDAYDQARHCSRCQATLPATALATPEGFDMYRTRLVVDLLATYLVAPVREVFPRSEVTNWAVTLSTPENPVTGWNDQQRPPTVPALFSATNPIAYGNTVYWRSWNKRWPVDREHVDQFYFHLLIRMVSVDRANVARWAPYLKCFPWVDRWCPDDEDPSIPIMSRERYREVLRHLWLRGVTGMQIFQPHRPGFEDICLSEVQDAVAIYDEMLADWELLDAGTPLSYAVPKPQDNGVVWSGMRLGARAVVRTFKQGGGQSHIKIEPWPGKTIQLEAAPVGQTYRLRLRNGHVVEE
jgi:hypothetical protein